MCKLTKCILSLHILALFVYACGYSLLCFLLIVRIVVFRLFFDFLLLSPSTTIVNYWWNILRGKLLILSFCLCFVQNVGAFLKQRKVCFCVSLVFSQRIFLFCHRYVLWTVWTFFFFLTSTIWFWLIKTSSSIYYNFINKS